MYIIRFGALHSISSWHLNPSLTHGTVPCKHLPHTMQKISLLSVSDKLMVSESLNTAFIPRCYRSLGRIQHSFATIANNTVGESNIVTSLWPVWKIIHLGNCVTCFSLSSVNGFLTSTGTKVMTSIWPALYTAKQADQTKPNHKSTCIQCSKCLSCNLYCVPVCIIIRF